MIKYKKINWKYLLIEPYYHETGIIGYEYEIKSLSGGWVVVRMEIGGRLLINKGYAWDGASGPTVDTLDTMRGSLVHDVLYQSVRDGHLPENYLDTADNIFHKILLEDGMSKFRAWYYFHGVNNWYVHKFHGSQK